MTLHELFIALQTWWLENATNPQALLGMRMFSGGLSLVAAALTVYNAIRPNEIEKTWNKDDCRRFGIIAWMKALGFVLAAIYFVCAAIFEADRINSPHRLLFSNVWVSLVMFTAIVDALAWRFHYYRKRMIMRKEDKKVKVIP